MLILARMPWHPLGPLDHLLVPSPHLPSQPQGQPPSRNAALRQRAVTALCQVQRKRSNFRRTRPQIRCAGMSDGRSGERGGGRREKALGVSA